ncbi:hypothetical protein [Nocardia nova]|nr:hypothetical protein [Nocardia nova]
MTDTKVPSDELRAAVEEPGSGLLIGKRYTVEDSPAELLVTKPGSYGITIDGRAVAVKEAKPLPASD